jgi:hypothetical protein
VLYRLLDTSPAGRIIKDVMRHELGEGKEAKKEHKKVAGARISGSEKHDAATDTVFDEIEPADFFDPEEFGIRRRFTNDA